MDFILVDYQIRTEFRCINSSISHLSTVVFVSINKFQVFIKLPYVCDTTHTLMHEDMDLEECRVKCLNNCSCMAFTNSDIWGGGGGCVLWFGDLIDIKPFQTGGQDLYILVGKYFHHSYYFGKIQDHSLDLRFNFTYFLFVCRVWRT